MKILSVLGLLWVYFIPIAARREDESSNGNIVEVLSTRKYFSGLVSLLSEYNLNETLTDGNYTIFAPSNYALKRIAHRLDGLTEAQIKEVLLYHVTQGKVFSADLSNNQEVATLRPGSNVTVKIKTKGKGNRGYKTIYINDSKVKKADVVASNGVIHIIDDVLLPDDLVFNTIVDVLGDNGKFYKLVGLLIDYNLTDTLRSMDNLTLVAPTNGAFSDIKSELKRLSGDDDATKVASVLKYHVLDSSVKSDQVVDGQSYSTLYPNDTITASITEKSWGWGRKQKTKTVIEFNDAVVVNKDIEASNGIIHGVDKVLIPPSVEIPSTIVDFVAAYENLSKLVELLTNSSSLLQDLQAPGPFTVFAPTNKAFDEVSSTLETKSPEEIENILRYHVVSGEYFSEDLSDGLVLETLFLTKSLSVSAKEYGGRKCKKWGGKYCITKIQINDSKLGKQGIDASNGVIHVINKVLLPSN